MARAGRRGGFTVWVVAVGTFCEGWGRAGPATDVEALGVGVAEDYEVFVAAG